MSEPTTVELPDGRALAYAEYGAADGRPVFCFHGNPGSRLLWGLFDGIATRQDVRVVAPERPGYGHSDFQSGRNLLDWPADVRALADRLGIDGFGVVGFSAGGPHAAACAHALADRLRGTVLVASVAPSGLQQYDGIYERGMADISRYVPGFSRAAFGAASWLADHWRSRFEAAIRANASEPDRELLEAPEGEVLLEDAAEAFRRGGRGPAHEFPLLGEDWEFRPGEVDVPVTLWHGRRDATIDLDDSRAFGDALPEADLHVTDTGHYSTLLENRAAILDAAVER